MRPEYRFTPLAARRIEEIAEWTENTFGPSQAQKYNALLTKRLQLAANGDAHLRPVAQITGQKRHKNLSVLKAGQHFLILRQEPDVLVVIDIIHQSSDMVNRSFN